MTNMKRLFNKRLVAIAGCVLLGVAGCSRSGGNIDTSRVQSAFQSAPPADKAEAQNAVSEVKAGNYAGALASLQKVAASANLTPEQKSAVQDLVGQVRAKATGMGEKAMGAAGDAANQAGQGAGKSADDLQKSFKK